MEPYWNEATALLKQLVQKAAGQDKDGMDLTFFAGEFKVRGKKDPSHFTTAMKKKEVKPMTTVPADIRKVLAKIFRSYLEQLDEKKHTKKSSLPSWRKPGRKDLTLIILTDGTWEAIIDKDDVKKMIVTFARELTDRLSLEHRPVSIQFIQFGSNKDAEVRLRELDNDLKLEGIP